MFVRSAVNSEDAADFNAAGLYSTIPNQIGAEAICRAIRSVWASTLSERAIGWRDRAVGGFAAVVPSVLVMPSIPVQKSGVLVTADLETGELDRWSVSAGEGIGAAVGDSASELLTVGENGRIRLLQEASSPYRTLLRRSGGVRQTRASIRPRVLADREIATLHAFVHDLRAELDRNPVIPFAGPWELEFGFRRRQLHIFQIRPFAPSLRRGLADEIVGDVDADPSRLVALDGAVAGAATGWDDAPQAQE